MLFNGDFTLIGDLDLTGDLDLIGDRYTISDYWILWGECGDFSVKASFKPYTFGGVWMID